MSLFKYICHQIPERSFYIKGHQFPVCSRCTGFYISAIIYCILAMFVPFKYNFQTFLLCICFIIPSFLDGFTQYIGIKESNNFLRLVTGLFGGLGVVILFKTLKFMILY